jgi:hypothetical protein
MPNHRILRLDDERRPEPKQSEDLQRDETEDDELAASI